MLDLIFHEAGYALAGNTYFKKIVVGILFTGNIYKKRQRSSGGKYAGIGLPETSLQPMVQPGGIPVLNRLGMQNGAVRKIQSGP